MSLTMLDWLRAADDPTEYEAPACFDVDKALIEIQALKPKLEAVIGRDVELDDRVQDASFFADLAIYRLNAKTNSQEAVIVVRFSAFGRLFTIYEDCATETRLPAEIIEQVIEIIERDSYHYIDHETLNQSYSGTHPYFVGGTWWYRFFDYN